MNTRTLEHQELSWSHHTSGTCFDTLPVLREVTVILSYWHSLKDSWHSQEGTISTPVSGDILKLSRMLLWNHPSMSMEPFGLKMLAFDETRGLHQAIPLTTTILTLGHKDLGIRIHLLIPDWESGHSDLHPRHMADLHPRHMANYPWLGPMMEAKPWGASELRS